MAFILVRQFSLAAVTLPVRCRSLYVKVRDSTSAALGKMQAKSQQEGIDRELTARKAFIKPTLRRQKNEKDAKFNQSKRIRLQLVEELLLDRKLSPF